MPRFQFSLWWLMVAITVVCILLFLTVTFGGFFGILIASVVWCAIPTPIVIFAIYARGDLQAFAIGALVPWVILLVVLRTPATTSFFAAVIWLLPMSALCGALAAATRRWIDTNLHN